MIHSQLWKADVQFGCNMVRPMPEAPAEHFGSMPLAIALFVSVSALVALCAKAKHVRRAQQHINETICKNSKDNTSGSSTTLALNSPLATPKKIVASLNNKAIPIVYKNKGSREDNREEVDEEDEDGFGQEGVWQRSILMGGKCQPPEFSGAIYYDSNGNQLSELPRSPRVASPLPSFCSSVARHANNC